MNPNLLTDQEILDIIREEFYEIRPNGFKDFFKNRKKCPCYQYLRKRFAMTYNEILMRAGIQSKELNLKEVNYNKDYYLEGIKQLAKDLEHTPTLKEYQQNGFSYQGLILTFKSYNQAIMEAGLKPNKEPGLKKDIPKKLLLKKYKDISNKLGHPATYFDIIHYCDEYTIADFYFTFGGMNGLRKEAGFKESNKATKNKYNKEMIVELLINEYRKFGRHMTLREIRTNKNLPSEITILTYFNTTSLSKVWAEIDHVLAMKLLNTTTGKVGTKNEQQSKKAKAGDLGEQKVAHYLDFLNHQDYKVYNDIQLRVDGLVQQIDHLVVGINGVFHLETKNYKGNISIDKNGNWLQTNGGTQMTIEDPEGQICRHEEVLSRILKNEFNLTSILVHAHPKCSLHHMERTTLTVLKAGQLLNFINSFKNEKNPPLTSEIISKICTKIERHIIKNHETAI